ncbi:MAG: hypothetical protein JXR40_04590 [Pontiellaceae bacterium]|nr:hypothetical protein [Pontiellaceae bacterium]
MREKFTLWCRVIGMILACHSSITILTAVPMFFTKPDVGKLLPSASILGDTAILNQLTQSANYMWGHMLLTVVLTGIVPLCLGIYMMKSGRFFINLCYPSNGAALGNAPTAVDPTLDLPSKEAKDDDRRWMPPEMRRRI